MKLSEAQEIMRDYMAPRSHAINHFAQTGYLLNTYDHAASNDDGTNYNEEAKNELLEAIVQERRVQRLQFIEAPVLAVEDEASNNIAKLSAVFRFVVEYF